MQQSKKKSDQKTDSKTKAARIISSLYKTGGGEGSGEELNSIDQVLINKMLKVSYMINWDIFQNFTPLHLYFY